MDNSDNLKKDGKLRQFKKINKLNISDRFDKNWNKRTQSKKRDVEARCDARA